MNTSIVPDYDGFDRNRKGRFVSSETRRAHYENLFNAHPNCALWFRASQEVMEELRDEIGPVAYAAFVDALPDDATYKQVYDLASERLVGAVPVSCNQDSTETGTCDNVRG